MSRLFLCLIFGGSAIFAIDHEDMDRDPAGFEPQAHVDLAGDVEAKRACRGPDTTRLRVADSFQFHAIFRGQQNISCHISGLAVEREPESILEGLQHGGKLIVYGSVDGARR